MGFFGYLAARDTNRTNIAIANAANQYNYEMWLKNNQYNLPVNVMQRYADAGLNPHLIYQQGAQGAISASPAPNMVVPEYKSPLGAFEGDLQKIFSLVNFASGIANISKALAEIKNIESLTQLNDAKKFTEWKRSILLGNQSDQISQRIRFLDKMNLYDLEAQRIGNRRAQYALMKLDPAQYAKTMSDLSYTHAKLREQNWRNSRFDLGHNPDDAYVFRALDGVVKGILNFIPYTLTGEKDKYNYNQFNQRVQKHIQ